MQNTTQKCMKAKRQNESEEEAIECKRKNAEYQRNYRSQKRKQNLDSKQEQPNLRQELMAGNKQNSAEYQRKYISQEIGNMETLDDT